MDTTKDKITISISRKTHKKLVEIGEKRDTFEDIIYRLFVFYEENRRE